MEMYGYPVTEKTIRAFLAISYILMFGIMSGMPARGGTVLFRLWLAKRKARGWADSGLRWLFEHRVRLCLRQVFSATSICSRGSSKCWRRQYDDGSSLHRWCRDPSHHCQHDSEHSHRHPQHNPEKPIFPLTAGWKRVFHRHRSGLARNAA
jgi:hypothetical protein